MRWFTKIAEHGNTLDGKMYDQELGKVTKDLKKLVAEALSDGPKTVLPRWRGEIRRAILMLPPEEKLHRMSMYEIKKLKEKLADIKAKMERYDMGRFMTVVGR